MTVRFLDASDLPWLEAEGSAQLLGPKDSEDRGVLVWEERGGPVAALQITLASRVRTRHIAQLALHAPHDLDTRPLWRAAAELIDEWSPCMRIQAELAADVRHVGAALSAGFEVEVVRRHRLGPDRDEVALGRLRPGWRPQPAGPPPLWPARASRQAPDAVELRPCTPEDAPTVWALSTEATSVWGTLQLPWSTESFYARRQRELPPGDHVFGVWSGGAMVGISGLHATGRQGVMVCGMAITRDRQGAGIGRWTLEALVGEARARGCRRLELSVFADNTRAHALYVQAGFVAEGIRRADAWRAGGWADSLEMAVMLE